MKKIQIVFITLFICILFVFMGFTITNNNEISDVEKRTLETFPKFNLKSLLKSEYYSKLTSAFNDQLFLRNLLVKGYFLFQFQHYIGDVVVGSNNEMFSSVQDEEDLDEYRSDITEISSYINNIANDLAQNNIKFIFLSIPRKDAVMTKYLPKTYKSSKDIYIEGKNTFKQNLNSNVYFIDALELFNDGDYYFKNDHHINVRGAEILYKEIMRIVNNDYDVKVNNIDDIFNVKKTFVNGSFNKQIGQSGKLEKEELELSLKENIKYKRYENGKISNEPIWGNGTTYEDVYMNGDKAETLVDTNRNELPNIMFTGSSFTNILESVSIPSFNKMLSIDYRHNKTKKDIVTYAKENSINYVVYVPSQSNNAFSYGRLLTHLGF